MVMTTPKDKSDEHKSWHKFDRGMCLYCGWYCINCPVGVATCKCSPPEKRADRILEEENSGRSDSWREDDNETGG